MRWLPAGALVAAALLVAWLLRPAETGTESVPQETEPAATQDLAKPTLAMSRDAPSVGEDARPRPARDVIGLVLDERDVPAAGVTVTVAHGSDAETAETATKEDGSFALRVAFPFDGPAAHVLVEARRGDAVAARTAPLAHAGGSSSDPPALDVGILRLREVQRLRVRVLGAADPESAAVQATFLPAKGPTRGSYAEADRNGVATFPPLVPGIYRLVAAAPERGRATAVVRLPRVDADPLPMSLLPERIVEIQVVDEKTKEPVPDAAISVSEWDEAEALRGPLRGASFDAQADAKGTARVRGLAPDDALSVTASAAGYEKPAAATSVPPRATRALLSLRPARRLECRVVAVGVPTPSTGTVLRLLAPSDRYPSSGRVRGGRLVVDGWPQAGGEILAVAPDGSMGLVGREDRANPTEPFAPLHLHPARSVSVSVRGPDGAPRVAWSVHAAGEPPPNVLHRSGSTDEHGHFVATDLYGGPGSRAWVSVRPPSGSLPEGTRSREAVDLSRGDARVELVVPDPVGTNAAGFASVGEAAKSSRDPVDLEVLVRVDGEVGLLDRRIPATLTANGEALRSVERDERRGLLRARWRPKATDKYVVVSLLAEGYESDSQRGALGASGGLLRLSAEVFTPASLDVAVVLPADGLHGVVLESKRGGWQRATAWELFGEPSLPLRSDRGEVSYPRLRSGSYRARDVVSGAVSEAVHAGARGDPARVALDLTRSALVEGVVLDPFEKPLGGARIEVRAETKKKSGSEGSERRSLSLTTSEDGRFSFRWLFTDAVRLVPRANVPAALRGGLLLADPPKEMVVVRTAR